MKAGELRHRITIEEKVITRDDFGGEVSTWMKWAENVPAAIAPLSGREFMTANTELGQVTTRFVIRYRPGVAPLMRIIHDGKLYNIAAVLPDQKSGRVSLTLPCTEGTNDG